MSDLRKDLARVIWEEEGRPCGAAFDEEDPCHKHQSSYLSLADTILASDVIALVRAEALREAYADLESYTDSGAPFAHRPVEKFLLHRADRIEREAGLK